MGGFASPLSKYAPAGAKVGSSWLYASSDGGASFRAVAQLGKLGDQVGTVIASPAPGTVLVARGTYQHPYLAASFDGGRQWADVYQGAFDYLGFTSASQGVAVVQSGTGTALLMSYDGGRHWAKAAI
jgi:photosystem II stability/assembly factor-like uncharacterized protein